MNANWRKKEASYTPHNLGNKMPAMRDLARHTNTGEQRTECAECTHLRLHPRRAGMRSCTSIKFEKVTMRVTGRREFDVFLQIHDLNIYES